VRISFTSDEEQSQNKQTASNPEGPVHSAHSLQCIISFHYQTLPHPTRML